jgi:hypothetical protein
MNSIIDGNEEIVNNIREIYTTASADKLRSLIEKHFIPTADEKKKNAEVPTPVKLVDEMLEKIPVEFWTTPKRVFEPCCGKGNFVLGIFDKFYEGLKTAIPDEEERCRTIMRECMYYADLTTLNVFITTELLKCHIQSYTGLDELDENEGWVFHSHVGDTLDLDVVENWGVNGFNAVIGNPPYNNELWSKFVYCSINNLDNDGYLLYVHPCNWRKPEHKVGKIMKSYDFEYLKIYNIKDTSKLFNCNVREEITLIEKSIC